MLAMRTADNEVVSLYLLLWDKEDVCCELSLLTPVGQHCAVLEINNYSLLIKPKPFETKLK